MPQRKCRLLISVIDLRGGGGEYCRNLARGLKRYFGDEFHISILTYRDWGRRAEDCEIFDRCQTTHFTIHEDLRRFYETIRHVFGVHEAIGRMGADVILAVGTYANILVPLAAPDRRVILTVHSNTSRLVAASPFSGLLSRLTRWRFPRSPVVGPSRGVTEDLRRGFGVRRAIVIPHGVDLERIATLAEESPDGLPTDRPFVVACGRLSEAKDYPTLFHGYAQAIGEGLGEDLLIIGEGEERGSLERLRDSLGLQQRIHMIGYRANPFGYLKAARFFVLSSMWEGFGLALVEAMAVGLPCIATDCPSGPAEILGNGRYGMVVPPQNPGALAGAMRELSASPERLGYFASQSRIRAREFSLEKMARRYRELLLTGKPPVDRRR